MGERKRRVSAKKPLAVQVKAKDILKHIIEMIDADRITSFEIIPLPPIKKSRLAEAILFTVRIN